MKPWVKLWKEKLLSSLNFQSLFLNEKALYILLYFYARDDEYSGGLCFPDGKPIALNELTKILSGRLDEVSRIIKKLTSVKLLYYDRNQILCIRNYARLTLNDYNLPETPDLPLNNRITMIQQQPNDSLTIAQQPIEAKSLKSPRNPAIDKDKDKDKEEDIKNLAQKPKKDTSQIRGLFDLFWSSYPKKVGKAKALLIWKRGKLLPSIEEILRAVEKQKNSVEWTKENGQFIPHATTWLNREGWNDQLTYREDWRR